MAAREAPGFGWPQERVWINPSPNAANLNMARAYAGTVMLEGTTLSEGRGTTRPLELFGAPDIEAGKVIAGMHAMAPQLARGLQAPRSLVRADLPQACEASFAAASSSMPKDRSTTTLTSSRGGCRRSASRQSASSIPDYDLWRDFPYEYEFDKLAIDVINGSPLLREWVDDASAVPDDLDALTLPDEQEWEEQRRACLRY